MYPGSGLESLEPIVHLCFIMRNSFLFDLAGAATLNKFSFLAAIPVQGPRLSVRTHQQGP